MARFNVANRGTPRRVHPGQEEATPLWLYTQPAP